MASCAYVCIYTSGRRMSIAKVFRSGNSQAVRLPKAFRVESKELEIFRRGDEIVLRERSANLERAFRALGSLPDDFLADDFRDEDAPQEREGL